VLPRYTCLLVGCGMGLSAGTAEFLERLLLLDPPPRIPLIIDADGLNNLSRLPDWWRRLGGQATVTPHPGEMATLTETSTPELQRDRITTAGLWSSQWGVTVCLKGAFTVIADPGGRVRVSPFANPGLASGGTGDVLTGIIAGFMAQVGCPLGTGTGGPGYTIDAEFNDQLHEAGVLSMARTSDPNSAGSQLFLCLDRAPHLDRQYTAFGKTADDSSLETLLTIGRLATDGQDRPTDEVRIETGQVIELSR